MTWNNRFSAKMNRTSWKTAHEDAHPQVDDMDDLQAHLMNHHEGDFIGDVDDHEWFHTDPTDYINTHQGLLFPIKSHDPDHWHTNDYEKPRIPDALPQSFASFNKLADPGSLRGEGVPAFTEPSYQDDDEEQLVTPQDLDSNPTDVTKFPKSVGVFKNSSWNKRLADYAGGTGGGAGGSSFGNPIDYNENRMQSLQSPGLGVSYPLDSGKRNYNEQRQDANPLTLRSWFTGDDVNGPWPHTKNLSGPLDFEPTDDQNQDSTGPVTGSFNSKYAHDDQHPWPQNAWELANHLDSHHNPFLRDENGKKKSVSGIDVIQSKGERFVFNDHELVHKNGQHKMIHGGTPKYHEHSDDLNIDVPENIETIAPTYITSSWHQSFVDTIPTNSDEELPNTLLNPADELKNGRPRANDLPQQENQLLPGMLLDHDQMGGSGTASAGF